MTNKRYYALDVFRGATVALMILVNNPGTWSHIFSPLQHAPWHGATPTDLVFPFFLFAVGNAMAFVIPRMREVGDAFFWKKVVKRTILIFMIGFFLAWWPFFRWEGDVLVLKSWVDPADPERGIRILGVLQRIALAYFFASAIVYYLKEKSVILVSIVILLVYWVLCLALGGVDPYSLEGWFGTDIDKAVLGIPHMYKGEGVPFDPEGLASTLPAIVQVIFGYLIGQYIRSNGAVSWLWPRLGVSNEPIYRMLSGLMVIAVLLYVLGLACGLVFPINKKIWTSSYVFYTTGLATATIGMAVWFTDVLGVKNAVTRFFDVFGKNPLFIFVLSGLLPGLSNLVRIPKGLNEAGEPIYTTPLRWLYSDVCAKVPGPPEVGSLVYAVLFISFCWLIAYIMDKKKIYVKV